jgi:transcriptional regulator with XRE-family HTH domain
MGDLNGDSIWTIEDTRGTAATGVTSTRIPTQTRTTAAVLTEDIGDLRRRVRELSVTASTVHQNAYMEEWQVLTQGRAALGGPSLLEALADLGFSWRDIARLVGISVPAIQKWRKGGKLSPENRRKLASLLAACDFITMHFLVEDIGQWFEMPITDSAPITPIDLWADGNPVLVFEYATRHLTPDETMDKFDPSWRERYRTNVEVFRDDDGILGLRIRE